MSPGVAAQLLRVPLRAVVKPLLGPHTPHRLQKLGVDLLARGLPGVPLERRRASLGGVPTLELTPADARPGATLLYFHGGGYVTGSAQGHAALGSRLAQAARARVVLVDYRLAPEHPFPAAHRDASSSYAALLAAGQDPARLTVAGDSAGGGLALACVCAARDGGLALPARLLMFSPWLDLRLENVARGSAARADPLLSRAGLERWAGDYCAGHARTDPRISPLLGELSGLPPTLVQFASGELLAADTLAFAERARAVGVAVELQPFAGVWHVFELFTQLPEARAAISMAGAFLTS